jgi:hypothetical protein
MFEVTWTRGAAVLGISTPKYRTALAVYISLRAAGYNARLWNRCTKRPALAL